MDGVKAKSGRSVAPAWSAGSNHTGLQKHRETSFKNYRKGNRRPMVMLP